MKTQNFDAVKKGKHVKLLVLQARNLIPMDRGNSSDPYCVVSAGGARHSTPVIEKTLNPSWTSGNKFRFGGLTAADHIEVKCMDKDLLGSDFEGLVQVELAEAFAHPFRPQTKWCKLLGKKGDADKERGDVFVQLMFIDPDAAAKVATAKELLRAQDTREAGLKLLEKAAKKGSAVAAWKLAKIHDKEYDGQADTFFRRAADLGHLEAKGKVGAIIYDGKSYYGRGADVPPDQVEGLKMLKPAAEAGSYWAQHKLAEIYKGSWTKEVNYQQLCAWTLAGAEKERKAAPKVGKPPKDKRRVLYCKVLEKEYAEKDKSVPWLLELGGLNNEWAMTELGMHYAIRQEPPDFLEAAKWFEKAAEVATAKGDEDGQKRLYKWAGERYHQAGEDARALECWRKGKCRVDIGNAFRFAWGVPEDLSVAVQEYEAELAEKHGDFFGVAALQLGRMYELGIGVPQNTNKAMDLFQKSHNTKNNKEAVVALADCYLQGRPGLAKNEKTAFNLLADVTWSGKANFRKAQCYDYGWGTKQDLAEAIKWYTYGSSSPEGEARAAELKAAGATEAPHKSFEEVHGPTTGHLRVPLSPSHDQPLLDACFRKQLHEVEKHLKAGGNPNAVEPAEKGSATPLYYAAIENQLEIAKLLFDYGADVNKLADGDAPIHGAAQGGHVAMCQFLIKYKADPKARNREGQTPAECAKGAGWDECAKFLETAKKMPYAK